FIQWRISIPTFGRLNTGGTTLDALAIVDGFNGRGNPCTGLGKPTGCKAYPTRMTVIDKYGGGLRIRVQDQGDSADVPTLIRSHQRQHPDHRVLGSMQSSTKTISRQAGGDEVFGGSGKPHRLGK